MFHFIKLKKIIFFIFIFFLLYFFGKTILNNFHDISNYTFSINYFYLVGSFLLFFIYVFFLGYIRKLLVNDSALSYSKSFYINAVAWLSRYIPGKAGMFLAKVYFLSDYGISKKRALVISIYENIFQILATFIVSLPIIFYYFFSQTQGYYIYGGIIFVIGSIVFLYPPIFYRIINLGLKLFKRDQLEKQYFLSELEIIKYLGLYGISTLINGIALWFMIRGITQIGTDMILPIVGIRSFAGTIGILALFAPGGLGVREGIAVVFLKTLFPLEIAILISVSSRLWVTVGDALIGVYVLVLKFGSKRKNKV